MNLEAYCVMPDHIHVLAAGDASHDSDAKRFAHGFKQALGYQYKQGTGEGLWHRSYYDHVVREDEPVLAHVAYILNNPIVARLVQTPAQWPYSGPIEALESVTNIPEDRSKDLSVRAAELAREFGDHRERGSV